MTTIVYDHKNKQVACDSRETSGSFICSDKVTKYHRNDSGLWFVSGFASDVSTLINEAEHNKRASDNVDAYALVVKDDGAYIVSICDGIYKFDLLHCDEGIGSGGRFALSALDFGKSAKDAVKYAATRDNCTGGRVRVYDIEKNKFV